MYYRRKIMLALLDRCGGQLSRLRFQKLLFLISEHQDKPAFDFVPYKFGAYSFRANADAYTMCKYGLLSMTDEKFWRKETEEDFFHGLKKQDKLIVETVMKRFGDLSGRELIEYTYRKYPYYAINSIVAERYLEEEEVEKIVAERVEIAEPAVLTIGYEGISVEAYFNRLLNNDVKALIDVRRNPMSMKYGFHKSQLQNICNSVGIVYYHIPELGIQGAKRKKLVTQEDYDELFEAYCCSTLLTETAAQEEVMKLYRLHGRIALTCFEKAPEQCHRSHLANNLKLNTTKELHLFHL
jgi:uncharacterized protein (DUF488 family)